MNCRIAEPCKPSFFDLGHDMFSSTARDFYWSLLRLVTHSWRYPYAIYPRQDFIPMPWMLYTQRPSLSPRKSQLSPSAMSPGCRKTSGLLTGYWMAFFPYTPKHYQIQTPHSMCMMYICMYVYIYISYIHIHYIHLHLHNMYISEFRCVYVYYIITQEGPGDMNHQR